MARPTKNNAQYFSHDADMRNDVKVKALRRRFQHKGYAVWCFILETLTDGEFFEIDYNELNRELLAADFDVSSEELQEIIDYCCKINLLQITDNNRLYSEAHQRRFASLITKRERDRERIARLINKRQGENTGDNEAKTSKINNSRGDNPHSKVKENKVKENKEKNIVYPYQDIINLWNEICSSLPRVKVLNGSRRNKIKCRLNEFGKTPNEWISTVKDLFERVQNSRFLRGETSGWVASFDWLFENSTNWVKVMEGNYADDRGKRAANKPGASETLGVGEFFDSNGRRTYGTGKATIPLTAPPRPGDRYSWDESSKSWVML